MLQREGGVQEMLETSGARHQATQAHSHRWCVCVSVTHEDECRFVWLQTRAASVLRSPRLPHVGARRRIETLWNECAHQNCRFHATAQQGWHIHTLAIDFKGGLIRFEKSVPQPFLSCYRIICPSTKKKLFDCSLSLIAAMHSSQLWRSRAISTRAAPK